MIIYTLGSLHIMYFYFSETKYNVYEYYFKAILSQIELIDCKLYPIRIT